MRTAKQARPAPRMAGPDVTAEYEPIRHAARLELQIMLCAVAVIRVSCDQRYTWGCVYGTLLELGPAKLMCE